jgi:hypothetical protein
MVGAPRTDQPLSHGTSFLSMVAAAKHLWGEHALSGVAHGLEAETRRVMVQEPLVAMAWYPSWMLTDWCKAVWNGPARQRDAVYATFVDRTIDLGWSRVRRMFVRMLTPGLLATRAAQEWRNEHSHGTVETSLNAHGATATFLDGPFVEEPLMQRGLAECFRYLASLSRVRVVRESHRVEPRKLIVDLVWR